MTKRLDRSIYNAVAIDGGGNVERIKSKYVSLYDYFKRSLPEHDKMLSCHLKTHQFEYLDELNDNSAIENVVNRYPKKMDKIAVLKPTAIKDLDSIDAKYRDGKERYDIAINREMLIGIIKKNISEGREVMSIDLGNGISFDVEYQLRSNKEKFIEDVADANARYETSRGIGAEELLYLATSVKEILGAKDAKDVQLLEQTHRWGKSYTAVIGKLVIPLHGSHGEELKKKHPMIDIVRSTDVEEN